jgi:hypothetical protein
MVSRYEKIVWNGLDDEKQVGREAGKLGKNELHPLV